MQKKTTKAITTPSCLAVTWFVKTHLWRQARTCCKRVSHFVKSSHFLCKCAVPELLTVTLAGPSPALLNRLQRGGQAKLSAALGARCLDKPGGLVAQLKLGQRGLASSLRCWEIPCVLQCRWPLRGASGGGGGWRWWPRPPLSGSCGVTYYGGNGGWGGKVNGNEAAHELLPAWGFIRKAKALNYWPCVIARSTGTQLHHKYSTRALHSAHSYIRSSWHWQCNCDFKMHIFVPYSRSAGRQQPNWDLWAWRATLQKKSRISVAITRPKMELVSKGTSPPWAQGSNVECNQFLLQNTLRIKHTFRV